ncbi:MAG: ribosome maturation factor RimM [Chitinophagales bacterium]
MSDQNLVSVGQIIGTFGYQGEVKVLPLTDFPERFNGLTSITIESRGEVQAYSIERLRSHKQFLLFKFQGIDSKEDAALLVKGYLKVREDEVFPLPEGSYYIYQLIGLQVLDEEKGKLGVLKDVLVTGANDVYVVDGGNWGEVLIPAIKEVILAVDLEQNQMRVKLLPGLVEEV